MQLDHHQCYAAIEARDPRFDGRFFTAVKTTGIYCRPVCPARVPKPENVVFYPSAAAAQGAGFRPCLRCRPETAPGTPAWTGTAATVRRAMRLIEEGALDDGTVEQLAARLGLGARQLGRLFNQHLGASPVAVAQTRRVLIAKHLLHDSTLSLTEVALASGFGSLRRFNELFAEVFKRPPGALRRDIQAGDTDATGPVRLKLSARPPYDWAAIRGFFALRAIAGVEAVDAGSYARNFAIGGARGTLHLRPVGPAQFELTVETDRLAILPTLIARIRRQFDLDCDPAAIAAVLGKDRVIGPLITSRPGLRVPGAFEPFEMAVRAVLGQQITVRAATGLMGRMVSLCGPASTQTSGLTHVFPSPQHIAGADLSAMPMPRSRQTALRSLAELAASLPDLFSRPREEARERLLALPGIGPWTADYIALRALGDPDAFAPGDVGLQRMLPNPDGTRPDGKAIEAAAEAWRPWRAYAAQHLWTADMPG